MIALFCLLLTLFASPLKSKSRLEAENAALRHQLIILRRVVRGRVRFTNGDRLFLILMYRWFPSILKAITIIRPETLVRWHRAGFRRYWRWKSCSLGGRPQIDADLRTLIRRVSVENPLWGAPRIHGELNWALMSLSQASPSIWSNETDRPPRDGTPFCVTTRRISPPWICSLLPPLALICSMGLSLCGWPAGASYGSISPQIPLQSGLPVRSQKHALGMRLRATSSVIGIRFTSLPSRTAYGPWASVSPSPQAHLGKTPSPKD
jgi:hypothetical protein